MKLIITEEEKNRIRGLYEQYSWTNSGTQSNTTTTKAEQLPTVPTYGSGGNVDITSRNWCLKYKIPNDQCIKKFCEANPNKCEDSVYEQFLGSISEIGMTVAPILVSFIPVVGPAIAVAIGLAEAAFLYKTGKTNEAKITALFSVLPFGRLVNKIPGLKSLGESGFKKIGEKVVKKQQLTNIEKQVVDNLNKQQKVVTDELNAHVKQLASSAVSKAKTKQEIQLLNKIKSEGLSQTSEEMAKSLTTN